MGSFRRFEDIRAWQRAGALTREIYAVSGQGAFARDFGLRDQMRRASVSVMANIAEGHGRGGNREFVQFLSTAKASACEVGSLLYVAEDQEYLSIQEAALLREEADAIAHLIGGLMRYLQHSSHRGTKYIDR